MHAYIFDAVRTPRAKARDGRDTGAQASLQTLLPHDLVSQLVDALAERNGDAAIDYAQALLLGCVGQIREQGGHIALVSRLASRLSNKVAAKTINNYCVSGLTAINDAVMSARAGESGLFLAGGVEMLSHVPFLADKAAYYSNRDVAQALEWLPPIMGAELIASREGYSKRDVDAITLRSHQRAHQAWEEGRFDASVVPVRDNDGRILIERDECIRANLSAAKLERFEPAFAELGSQGADAIMLKHFPELGQIAHVHSVANTPGLCDGAALTLIGNEQAAERSGLKPRARVIAVHETGGNPIAQLDAGFDALEAVLHKAELALSDMDLIEFMEAFAATPLKFERNYIQAKGLSDDRMNVNGGHLAMGHPMGATGAILTATLLAELERREARYGLVVAMAAGGLGSAMIIERL